MEEYVKIVVDQHHQTVQRTIPLLKSLKDKGIILPSLCYHPRLEPYGSCGLCILEVYGQGSWKVRHACLMQAEEGLQIRTESTKIYRLRARAAQLLLQRGPFSNQETEQFLINLTIAAEEKSDQSLTDTCSERVLLTHLRDINKGCILCGLCVRICSTIGKKRLVFFGRGRNLRVRLVEGVRQELCGRCSACSQICPTGFIRETLKSKDEDN